ncbi:MAG: 16S rRNA (guanine(527)-N(7))-methyltransferase RsmG [Nitrospirales bacterium]
MEQSNSHRIFLEIFCEGSRKFGWTFSEKVLDLFWCFYRELCLWENVVNLTGLKYEREKIVLLFLDSLNAQSFIAEKACNRIVDIGTGAGFPGIPLQIVYPDKQVYLVEAKAKKVAFLLNVVGKLNLYGTSVIQQRIEDIAKKEAFNEKLDMAMIKGVNVSHITPYLNKILHKDGKLMVFRSENSDVTCANNEMMKCKDFSYELPFGFGKRTIELLEFR